ncbi:hypothetical protein GCM10010387_67410 [Streptomyces inusitatus]|uniref:DUF2637 domain-containing protein n=1 Tax=Streptomyces inusitatus TaxID=68221 RepID=A0A918V3W3_9ACTN|nr:hypothetical protein [Streptomyces inusitatus]GGZ64849.1 hypothetical protein GCM10010387_67410 [Streptomyces inusitatus]
MSKRKAWRTGSWWLDRGIVLVAAFIAGGAALYASFDALTKLAEVSGWSPTAAPALPLTVDVIALAAGVRYVRLHPDAVGRAMAFRGVKWSVAVSVVGNAIVHGVITPGWSWQHRAVAIAVSAVPAAALAYIVHLVAEPMVRTLARTAPAPAEELPGPDGGDGQEVIEDDSEESESGPEPVSPPLELFQSPPRQQRRHAKVTERKGSKKKKGLALMAAAVDAGQPLPSTTALSAALDCSPRYAQMIHEAWREKTA